MTSVQYDGTELQNTTYLPRTVQHESAPQRLLDLIKLARQDGSVIVDDTFGEKYITIPGILKGSSLSDLETKIDAFKELISRKDKNLDISFAGGTRRYVCRSVSHEFNRDFYHLLYVPYTVKFFVVGAIGKDTAETTPLNATGITATTDDRTVNFGGSYRPKPRHKITVNTRGNADVIRISNQDTGDYMEVDLDGFSGGDYIEIDEENQTVKKNGSTAIDYRGKFPSVVVGNNNLRMTVYGSGYTVDQQQTLNTGGSRGVSYDATTKNPQQAQSIVLDQSGRIGKIEVYVDKDGSPGGKMQWHFRKDANGVPDMTASGRPGNEEFEIAAAGVPASQAFTEAAKAVGSVFLKAGVKYWLFLNPGVLAGTSSSDFYGWFFTETPTDYAKGKAMANKIAGQPYVDGVGQPADTDGVLNGQYDFMFKIYRGDGAAASHTVAWRIDYTKKYL